jgi:hypothetical protein
MTDRFDDSERRRIARAAAPVLLFAATAACASQPLPPRGSNPERLAVPSEPTAVQPPAATVPASIVDATRADLLKRLGAAARDAKPDLTVRESVVWADGSLGCAKPGERYTMAEVPGWRLVWRVGERDWEYHASARGAFVYCERPPGPAARKPGDATSLGDSGVRRRLPTK